MNLPISGNHIVVNYSRMSASLGEMKLFEGHPSTRGGLTNLRNKPQQKQPGQVVASVPG